MNDQPTALLQTVAPLFFVRDVVAATEYYVRELGFTQPPYWGEPPCFAMPSRDGLTVMLKNAEDGDVIRSNNAEASPCGGPWDAYFWVDDARRLFDQVRITEANIAYDLRLQQEYNNWEFGVRDTDGYLLAFESDGAQPINHQANEPLTIGHCASDGHCHGLAARHTVTEHELDFILQR